MSFQALPGFRDFPPEDLSFRSHIQAAWRRVAARYGFVEYDGPPLEPLDLYTAKSGDEIVTQLFEFTDKGDRRVAMRPEMTPTFARMVSAHAGGMRKPIRWFSVPQLFRYEKQQKGRLREHFQLNCDLVGETDPRADAEVIALAIDVCRELGLSSADFRVRLSDRVALNRILTHAGLPVDRFADALGVIDKLERTGAPAARARLDELGLGSHADAIFRAAAIRSRADLEAHAKEIGIDAAEFGLLDVVAALDAMGLGDYIEIDFTIVRGLAYYTGTVFELFDVQRSLRAICGGGRYDTLLASLGGVDLPAVGFGMGDVVLGELLKERGLKPEMPSSIDAFVASVTADDAPHVLALVHELRDAGLRVEHALAGGNLGKQLKLADARGARMAVVIGPDDRERGEVQVKDLVRKLQEPVPRASVATHCLHLLTTTD
ncbi:MAG: histidine--tRNA ligase [Gemmatimonadales bacterium]